MPPEGQEPLAPASTTDDPTKDNGSQSDAAALQEQIKKLEMERNLLRNKSDKLERERLEREKKELEEKEDYRSLAERAQAELEALRKEREESDTRQAVQTATNEVFSGFDPKVIEIAKTTGLAVSSDTPEARDALKTKLEAIQSSIGASKPKVAGANPAPASSTPFNPERTVKLMHVDDRDLRENAIKEAVGRHPQVAAFREFGKRATGTNPQAI